MTVACCIGAGSSQIDGSAWLVRRVLNSVCACPSILLVRSTLLQPALVRSALLVIVALLVALLVVVALVVALLVIIAPVVALLFVVAPVVVLLVILVSVMLFVVVLVVVLLVALVKILVVTVLVVTVLVTTPLLLLLLINVSLDLHLHYVEECLNLILGSIPIVLCLIMPTFCQPLILIKSTLIDRLRQTCVAALRFQLARSMLVGIRCFFSCMYIVVNRLFAFVLMFVHHPVPLP